MLTEYGADANLAHQTEYLGDALNWGKPFYPETFQTKTHELPVEYYQRPSVHHCFLSLEHVRFCRTYVDSWRCACP